MVPTCLMDMGFLVKVIFVGAFSCWGPKGERTRQYSRVEM